MDARKNCSYMSGVSFEINRVILNVEKKKKKFAHFMIHIYSRRKNVWKK